MNEYTNTQEKINLLKSSKDAAQDNAPWLLGRLEEMNKRAEHYEQIISAIANIDTLFINQKGEDVWDAKEAFVEIERLVKPVWEEVANRKHSSTDGKDMNMSVLNNESDAVMYWRGIANFRQHLLQQKEVEFQELNNLIPRPDSLKWGRNNERNSK